MGESIAHTKFVSRCMEQGLVEKVFPGAVLLYARENQVLYHEAFGTADLSSGLPMSRETIFDLASLTKPLATAILTCLLIQEKKLTLSTELGDIISDFANSRDKSGVTVDMLLRHTSGLPAYKQFFLKIGDDNAWGEMSCRDRIRRLIVEEPLEAIPGSRQNYSDLGYIVLAWILEKITNIRFDKAVQKKIYEPLGIHGLFFVDVSCDSDFPRGELSSGLFAANHNCSWRRKILKGQVDDENAWAAGGIEGHAGLFGDAMSVYILCKEILSAITDQHTVLLDPLVFGKFVGKYSGQKMVAGFDTPNLSGSSAGSHVSLRAIGHLGFTGTSFWIDPDSKLIVVLLTNRTHPDRSNELIRQFRPLIHNSIFSAY